jgi:hypothetical protein
MSYIRRRWQDAGKLKSAMAMDEAGRIAADRSPGWTQANSEQTEPFASE